MKQLIVVLTFVVVGAWSLTAPVYADDSPKYGYVDMRKVLVESKAGKRSKTEMEKLIKQKQDQLAKEQEKLQAMQEAYDKEQLVLSDAQKQQRQQAFQEKVQAYKQMAAAAQKDLGQKDNEFTRKVVGVIRGVIAEVAKEQNLVLVFEKNEQPVLYAKEGPDLTDLVIKRYDAKAGK